MSLAGVAMLLVLAEGVLTLSGSGISTRFFVETSEKQHLTANRRYCWQYYPKETATVPHPFLMPVTKPQGTKRLFVLGESAALGTPDPAFGFARILEVMLAELYPSNRFEIINVAVRGINSHIVLPIGKECLRHNPDVLLVYMGNNEVIGHHAPEPGKINLTPYLGLLRLGQWARSTQVGQWTEGSIRKIKARGSKLPPSQDMEFFRQRRLALDDPLREAVYRNFEANLEDLLNQAARAGAKVALSTIAVNLKDFPPLASLHGRGLEDESLNRWGDWYAQGKEFEAKGAHDDAIKAYLAAAAIDDQFAELHFRLARCLLRGGQSEQAKQHFGLARDWDAMQFRADSRINEIIRNAASSGKRPAVFLIDAEESFSKSSLSAAGIPGSELFHEHVHFTFEGDYLLAQTFLPAVIEALGLGKSLRKIPSKDQCAEALAYTFWDKTNIEASLLAMTAKPPFLDQLEHEQRQKRLGQALTNRLESLSSQDFQSAIQDYRKAIARRPADWQLQNNLGNLFLELNNYSAAISQFQTVVKLLPDHLPARLTLANCLLRAGKTKEAIRELEEVLRLDPEHRQATEGLAQARSSL